MNWIIISLLNDLFCIQHQAITQIKADVLSSEIWEIYFSEQNYVKVKLFLSGKCILRKKLVLFCWGLSTQIAKFVGPTWGPPGSCRPQMGPMLAPCTLLSGYVLDKSNISYWGRVCFTEFGLVCLWAGVVIWCKQVLLSGMDQRP